MEVHLAPANDYLAFVTAPEYGAEFEIWGNCPVQCLGTLAGRDIYFRARNRNWTFDVADRNGNLPSDGYRDSDGFYRHGDFPNAGWMSLSAAIRIIEQCFQEYISRRTEPTNI